ncbi:DNA-processing protein DprA [Methylococcus geothermalis]|uniref:DNA-protecting protein DprA n=1 Tax=Methylococcus geothermalis TaxID=2681310 RepID=A0A858Q5Y4_9GAMM|nr:DNA-processing protein DprA [Methylococcus geothermalis]QJD29146.1 DNA-protecting protein DprA [Methylococcus geothermalis]
MPATPLRYWLALARIPGVGPRRAASLLDRFGAARAVFGQPREAYDGLRLSSDALHRLARPAWDAVEADLAWLSQPGHSCITLHDPEYPSLLREIADPPVVLFVRGDPALLRSKQIAIVGSRNPSATGERTARQFAAALSRAGLAVTSGLALGIDAAGHQGALEAGAPTVAVFGCGPDRIYPPRHQALADAIAGSGGALVSEFPPGTPPSREGFPRRNRIISGLSLGVLVVEAALKSGSLITARQAMEQGREVFAIPGSIHDPLARGCNALIREGAKLVESVPDILEELGALAGFVDFHGDSPAPQPVDAEAARILAHIAYAPTSVDTLVAATGYTANLIASKLVLLEMEGHVAAAPGGGYRRIK